ncbi:hypothetical protein WJX72_007937 [[Myrmecia] bisecta]|uniref:RNA polymerase II C-terminal domain phosphatase-like n=1 Tax=[Myrmecia] bisecta TaxID=41462 RepID=A0AAW1Q7R2_9CHLO
MGEASSTDSDSQQAVPPREQNGAAQQATSLEHPEPREQNGAAQQATNLERPEPAAASQPNPAAKALAAGPSRRTLLRPGKRRRTEDGEGPSAAASCPPHPGFMHGICIRCGALSTEADDTAVAFKYIHEGLQLSGQEADRIRSQHLMRVLNSRKLLLVLDLDHTLLASTRLTDVDPDCQRKLHGLLELEAQGPESARRLHHLPHMNMWTCLRPFVREFLEAAHERFELQIYTHGDQDYAREMARILDPTRKYFAERIISAGDSTRKHVKNLDVVLGAEAAALILDDTEGVWPEHRHNLILMHRYIYFPACANRFGIQQPSLLQRDTDEDPTVGPLATVLGVMQRTHERFFAATDPASQDVRSHLGDVRREVLAGVELVFSRVIPLAEFQPERNPLWQLAVELGAACAEAVSERTTHVVAAADHTSKVRWAHKHGKPVVSPDWLYAASFMWRKPDEADYGVAAYAQAPAPLSREEDMAAAAAGAGGGQGDYPQQPVSCEADKAAAAAVPGW